MIEQENKVLYIGTKRFCIYHLITFCVKIYFSDVRTMGVLNNKPFHYACYQQHSKKFGFTGQFSFSILDFPTYFPLTCTYFFVSKLNITITLCGSFALMVSIVFRDASFSWPRF